MWNLCTVNLMIKSCGKSIEIDFCDLISRRRESAARRCLRALRRQPSVASFALNFSPVPLMLERKLRAGSVGSFMYFHLVYSPEFFAVASGRTLTRKLFPQATELMVTPDHEFVGNSTSPPFPLLSYPFQMGISLPLGERLTLVLWDTYGCKKPRFVSCANANFLYL